MVAVVDPKTGQQVDLEANLATQAFLGGEAAVRGDMIPVRSKDGVLGTVPAANLDSALRSGGFQLADAGELAAEEARIRYSSAGQIAGTAAEGALRGLTFGLSDPVLGAVAGEDYSAAAEARRQANPGTAIVGELGGALAPLLLSGGTSAAATGGSMAARGAGLAARAVTAPARALSAAGRGAGSIAEVLGAGKLGARIASSAAEGALMGAGHLASEATLSHQPIDAERAIATIGMGAILGGAIGGIGEVLSRGAARVGERVGSGEGAFQRLADRQAVKATGATPGQELALKTMADTSPEAAALVPSLIRDEIPKLLGKPSLARLSRAEMAKGAETLREQTGERIGTLMRRLDDAVPVDQQPDMVGIVERIRRDVVDPLRQSPGMSSRIKQLTEYTDEMLELGAGSPFSAIHKMRRAIDQEAYKAGKMLDTPAAEAFRGIRKIIESEIESKIGLASKALEAEYAGLKRGYQAAGWVAKATQAGAKTEEMIEASGSALGGLMGAAGSLASGSVMPLVAGLAHGAVSGVARKYGDQVLAAGLGGLAKGSLPALRAPSSRAVQRVVAPMTRADFAAKREQVSVPSTVIAARVASGMEGSPPGLVRAAVERALAAQEHLKSTLPRQDARPGLDGDTLTPAAPSAIARWSRVYDAIDNPQAVLARAEAGTLTGEEVAAVKAVFPEIYLQIQQAVLGSAEKPDTQAERRMLGMLAGKAVDPSQTREFVMSMQATYRQKEQQNSGPAPKTGVKLSTSLASSSDKVATQ